MFSKLRHLVAPLMLISAFFVSFSCPFLHVFTPLVPWFVRGMLFLVFLQLDWSKLRLRWSHFRILAANLIIPLVFYCFFYLLGQPGLALGAFFAGIAPTGTACPALLGMLKLDVEYGVSSFVVTTFGVCLSIPLLLPSLIPVAFLPPEFVSTGISFFRLYQEISFQLFQSLASVVFLPLGAALAIRWFQPEIRNHFKGFYSWTSFLLWIATITVMTSYVANFIQTDKTVSTGVLVLAAVISLIICIIDFTVGYLIGPSGFKHESSQTLGQKNIMIPFVLAQFYVLDPLASIVPLCYIVCHNSWNAWQMICLKE